jgi:hypothetical protein
LRRHFRTIARRDNRSNRHDTDHFHYLKPHDRWLELEHRLMLDKVTCCAHSSQDKTN